MTPSRLGRPSTIWRRGALAAAFTLPFVAYFALILGCATNVPLWDDFTILDWLLTFRRAASFGERTSLLLAPLNEHLPVIPRLLFLAQRGAFGSVDFRLGLVLGNGAWIAVAGLLIWAYRCQAGIRLGYLLPVPFILLAATQGENFLCSMGALQHGGCVLLGVLFLVLVARERTSSTALVLFPLAVLFSSTAFAYVPPAALHFARRRRWRQLGALATLTGGMLLLAHLCCGPQIKFPSLRVVTADWRQYAGFFLAFPGNGPWGKESSVLLGAVILPALAIGLWLQRRQPVLFCLGALPLFVALMATLGRGRLGAANALATKYAIYSSLALAQLYVSLLASARRAPLRIVVFLSGLVLGAGLWGWTYREGLATRQFQKWRWNKIGEAIFIARGGMPDSLKEPWIRFQRETALKAKEAGVYDYERPEFRRAVEKWEEPTPPRNAPMLWAVDSGDRPRISGWAALRHGGVIRPKLFVLLFDGTRYWRTPALPSERDDVATEIGEFARDAGFYADLHALRLGEGKYRIGLFIEDIGRIGYVWTNRFFDPARPVLEGR